MEVLQMGEHEFGKKAILGLGVFLFMALVLSLSGCSHGGGGGNSDPEEAGIVAEIMAPDDGFTVTAGDAVSFKAFSSQDGCSYHWDFGGAASNIDLPEPGQTKLSVVGTFVVTLKVSKGDKSETDQITVIVEPAPLGSSPVAAIISPASNVSISKGQSVNFLGSVSGGTAPYTYSWNFGGGAANSTLQNPSNVTFNTAGAYVVNLTVTDSNGLSSSSRKTVTVVAGSQPLAPYATITSPAGAQTIFKGTSLSFQGVPSGGKAPYTYLWSFGGGLGTSNAQNPGLRTFSSEGSYNVEFQVTDANFLSGKATVMITVVSGIPVLTSPASGATINTTGTTLTWNAVTGATAYRVRVATNNSFSSPLVDQRITTNQYTLSGLTPGHYFWQVSAYDAYNTSSAGSEIRDFSISTTHTQWSMVSSKQISTLAIRSDGTIWAWGDNTYGQLGDGTKTYKTSPTRIGDAAARWLYVTTSGSSSFGIQTNGSLWAWGNNEKGKLGDGTTTERLYPVLIGSASDSWNIVEAGNTFTVGIKSDSSLYVWGDNTNGQLGDNQAEPEVHTPLQLGADTWMKVAAGSSSAAAIKSDGSLWVWGLNDRGQLADGTTATSYVPQMKGSAADIWSDVAMGPNFMLAIRGGGLYGAGDNQYGQIGGTYTATPQVSLTRIGVDSNWLSVTAGGLDTLAIKANGTIWGMGHNGSGQFGIGTAEYYVALSQLGALTNWTKAACGNQFTMRINTSGTLMAAGVNNVGQLGDGTTLGKTSLVIIDAP